MFSKSMGFASRVRLVEMPRLSWKGRCWFSQEAQDKVFNVQETIVGLFCRHLKLVVVTWLTLI